MLGWSTADTVYLAANTRCGSTPPLCWIHQSAPASRSMLHGFIYMSILRCDPICGDDVSNNTGVLQSKDDPFHRFRRYSFTSPSRTFRRCSSISTTPSKFPAAARPVFQSTTIGHLSAFGVRVATSTTPSGVVGLSSPPGAAGWEDSNAAGESDCVRYGSIVRIWSAVGGFSATVKVNFSGPLDVCGGYGFDNAD